MTLADMIQSGPLSQLLMADPETSNTDPETPATESIADMTTVPVIVADNVAEYFFAALPREDHDLRRDFRDLTPRFGECLIEMARPSRIYSCTKGISLADHLPVRWGWRFAAASRAKLTDHMARSGHSNDTGRRFEAIVRKLAVSGLVDVAAVMRALDTADPYTAARDLSGPEVACLSAVGIDCELDRLRNADASVRAAGRLGWLLHAWLVVEIGAQVVGPVATVDIPLDAAGRVLLPPLFDFCVDDGSVPGLDPEIILSMLFPALLAILYLNCESVSLRPRVPEVETRSPQARDPRSRRHDYTLDIDAVIGSTRN